MERLAESWRVPEVVVPASGVPLALADARWQLQVGDDLDDDRVTDLVERATANVEDFHEVSVLERTLRIWIDYESWCWSFERRDGYRYIPLPAHPAKEISAVKVWTRDDQETEVTSGFALLGPRPSKFPVLRVADSVLPSSPRHVRLMSVEWVAGWDGAANVPARLRDTLLLGVLLAHEETGTMNWQRLHALFANRKTVR